MYPQEVVALYSFVRGGKHGGMKAFNLKEIHEPDPTLSILHFTCTLFTAEYHTPGSKACSVVCSPSFLEYFLWHAPILSSNHKKISVISFSTPS